MPRRTGSKPPKPPKRRGRPAGSKNKAKPLVTLDPLRCPKCESTDLVVGYKKDFETDPNETKNHGIDQKTSAPFTSVQYYVYKCRDCAQNIEVRKLIYDPSKWVGEPPNVTAT